MNEFVELNNDDFSLHDASNQYAQDISGYSPQSGLEAFQINRNAFFNLILPILKSVEVDDEKQKDLQQIIEKVKSIKFIPNGYIDNLALFFVICRQSTLNHSFLIEIIDQYIKPDSKIQGVRPLHQLSSGYFFHALEKYGAQKDSCVKVMAKFYAFSPTTVENNIQSYMAVKDISDQDTIIKVILDFIVLFNFYERQFSVHDIESVFTKQHHSVKAKNNLLNAYRQYSNYICREYIPRIQKWIKNPPEYFLEMTSEEFRDFAFSYDIKKDYATQSIEVLCGSVFCYAMHAINPSFTEHFKK